MRYVSTRGGIEPVGFKETVMMGLATDGGLLLPQTLPSVDSTTMETWRNLSYPQLAVEVMSLFVAGLERPDLEALVESACTTFDTPEVTPLIKMPKVNVLELFHGPTLSFKDIALQFLGNLFSLLLKERGETMNILGATSGDTGSAAIYGVKGKENINIFILHPHGRVSSVQALQMTTVPEANVWNVAIEGTFDDCQTVVKAIFNDIPFKQKHRLGAVNSINWARILSQVVYYVYAYLKLNSEAGAERVNFAVPTGNFGDIFAGYVAKRLIPGKIGRLVLATNENNILTRFVHEGRYVRNQVVPTISPSMDIQIASNFERYLYYLFDQDPARVRDTMTAFETGGEITCSLDERSRVRKDFVSASIDQGATLTAIRDVYKETGYVLDPHTAVGVAAVQRLGPDLPEGPVVCLATAHPAKFPEAVRKAIGKNPERPAALRGIEDRPRRCERLPADVDQVKRYIEDHAL